MQSNAHWALLYKGLNTTWRGLYEERTGISTRGERPECNHSRFQVTGIQSVHEISGTARRVKHGWVEEILGILIIYLLNTQLMQHNNTKITT